jgi:hypothetical protein
MLGNFNPKAIQDLKNLRAETNEGALLDFAKIHFSKTSFNTVEELVAFLNKLPDDECDQFISELLRTTEP